MEWVEQLVDSIMLNESIDSYNNIINSNLIGTASMVNVGRDAANEIRQQSQTAMYSAMMDNRTCPLCADLDGMYSKVGSDEYYNYSPPLHGRCRCIWVYIGDESSMPQDNFRIPSQDLVNLHGHNIKNNMMKTIKNSIKAYEQLSIFSLANLNAGNKVHILKDTMIKVKSGYDTIEYKQLDVNGEVEVYIPKGTILKLPFKIKMIGKNKAKVVT